MKEVYKRLRAFSTLGVILSDSAFYQSGKLIVRQYHPQLGLLAGETVYEKNIPVSSVINQYNKKGQIIIDKEECEMDADDLMMTALDAGAEDFSEEEDSYEVLTAPDDFSAVREALEQAGVPMLEAQVAMIPQTTVELTDEKSLKDIQRILDLLDDDDDVTDVWHNWDE